MIKPIQLEERSDLYGSLASGICLVHCIATPFIFAAHAEQVSGHHDHLAWWGIIDIIFLLISFVAILWSSRNTSKQWMKYALWFSWVFLAGVILNEKFGFIPLIEEVIYLPSLSLVVLHLYNRKYCRCKDDDCCSV